MKTIENKLTKILKSEDVFVTYSDLFVAILNRPVQKVLNMKEMRRDIKLLGIFEDAAEAKPPTPTVEVSDEDYTYLAGLVENSEWAVKHIDIIGFADYIESLA